MFDGAFSGSWLTYLGVIAISIWGGIVKYMSSPERFTWSSFVAQVMSSSFAGMLVFLACQYSDINGPLTGVLCGAAGHLGTPAIIKLAMKLKFVKAILSDDKEAEKEKE